MADAAPKPLKLVKLFNNGTSPNEQDGYEKVDSDRVIERFFYPLRWRSFDKMQMETEVVVTLYDFKSFTATETRETINRSGEVIGGPSHTVIPFSAFENKQAIADAHRALTELGGEPASIEALLNEDVTTKKTITPMKAIQLNNRK